MKKLNYKFVLKIFLRKLNMLTVIEVQWLFRLYKCEHTKFWLRGQSGKLYRSTSATLRSDWIWIKGQDFASSIPTRFEGGPAGVDNIRKYYSGTLVTVLLDRIMLRYQRCDTPITWLVRFDSTSTKAIWDQLDNSIPETMRKYSSYPKTEESPTQRTLFDLNNPVTETVILGNHQIPIYENGVQGWGTPPESFLQSVGCDRA